LVRQASHIYEFGPFRLIPEERQLLRDNQSVPLTPKSFDLLVVLVENSGHLIEKAELMKRIWPDSFVEEANLSVNMSALRRSLGEGPNEHQYVETVPRRGYRFVADVKERRNERMESASSELNETDIDNRPIADEVRQTTSAFVSPTSHSGVYSLRWLIALVGLMLVAAVLVGLNAGGLRERLLGKSNPLRIQSLAVLPLENLSGDTSQDYFADGMTESVITELAKIGALRVMSRPSVM
jgi:DNA-binding winged helix-turn-helix (wHTH) protein